jgi:hypothetical protein
MGNNNFIKTLSLIFIITIGASSCSIQKRRYTKGYYLNLSLNKGKSLSKKPLKSEYDNPPNKLLVKKQPRQEDTSFVHTQTGFASNAKNKVDELHTENLSNPNHKVFSNINSNTHKSVNTDTNHLTKKNSIMETNKINTKLKNNTMTNTKEKNKSNLKRKLAIVIGIALLLMAVIAVFSAPVISEVFVLGNSSLTALNVINGFSKFTSAIMGWIGIFILDLLVSIGIYKHYKKENPKKALITAILRLIYSAFLGLAIIQLLEITATMQAVAIYTSINLFNSIWGWGLIAFGLHLIALGVLFKNEGGKKWVNTTIKALLIIAGIGYMILYIGILIAPNPLAFAAFIQTLFLVPFILGEVLYAIWMLIKGGKKVGGN